MRSNTNKSCHLSLKDAQELRICERRVATQKQTSEEGDARLDLQERDPNVRRQSLSFIALRRNDESSEAQ